MAVVPEKKCSACGEIKSAASFYLDKKATTGLMAPCKPCHIARTRKWQSRNAERFKSTNAANKAKDAASGRQRERLNKWRKANPEKRRAQDVRKRATNCESIYARNQERTATQKRQTPSWANRFIISEIYDCARLRTKLTGVKHHVDHIVPLKGKNVSGLHVENNLRVVPARLNLLKSNHFSG
jgi:hypothetical protein